MISRLQRLVPMLLLVLFCGPGAGSTFSESEKESAANLEYQVKAGFIYNFLRFISWPKETMDESDTWIIGVLGNGSDFNAVRDALTGKSLYGVPVEVIKLRVDEYVIGCHVVFVMDDIDTETLTHFTELKRRPILTVGESKDFAKKHGIIGFVQRNGNLRLQINPTRAKNSGLVISGKLASLAELVEDSK